MLDEIRAGRLTAFSPLDTNLPTTYADIEAKMGATTRTEADPDKCRWCNRKILLITEQAKPEEVKQLLLYEEWYFDKKLSKLDVRIIGIEPYCMGFDAAS